ncbi:protein canopy homolog 2-like [Mizuhopecten yessoensis]|uniref:Canopy-like 2 protein n=1 Tax=Mizuhopecten yessoensis TaxID=6573 RepID=A0A210R6Y7_MIZYE|nr:protein canopy homolog 2-like [Mizuhopecten yessoensis]XP_021372954.1 protein canopy homolog 2-like [Mizuhopecten yessoensis]XP_021373029.1 protein canopy homolog 2-like [Mizuhopecten yessoensis]OWF56742.1 Canopy-like 2 protein [Mizuhopecten yessoensis]
MDLHISWTFLIPLMLILTEAKKDKELYCAVCRALVDEIHFSISEVDPKKLVQVGSFRIDGKGNQLTKQVPLARSELHLTELMEGVCERFKDYAETKNSEGKKSVLRTASRNGKPISLQNISISTEKQKLIRFACDSILEDHEEEIMTAFQKYTEIKETEEKVCREMADLCSEADLQISMPSSEMTAEEIAAMENASDSDDTDTEDGDDVDSESDDSSPQESASNDEEYVEMTNQQAEKTEQKSEKEEL